MCEHSHKLTRLSALPADPMAGFAYRIVQCYIFLVCVSSLTLAEIYKIRLQHVHMNGGLNEAVQERGGKGGMQPQQDNLRGMPGQGYYIEMYIGSPRQKLNVLVDTGSSNFAVAAAPHPDILKYFKSKLSKTFRRLGREVYVPYTQGNWKGFLGHDIVQIATLPNVSVSANVACITGSQKFFINGSNWQGILGLAYAKIARPDASVEPFFDSLVKQTKVNNLFSLQLCGTIDTSNATDVEVGGSLIVGGVDKSLYQGELLYIPVYKEWYYEVVVTGIKVKDEPLTMDCKEYNYDKSIVDSGTTNLRLPRKVFYATVRKIRAHTRLVDRKPPPEGFWFGEDILCWPEGQTPWHSFPPLTISLAQSANTSIALVVSPQQYLRAVKDEFNTSSKDDCYKFAVTASESGTVLGAVIMEGYYVVFDRENHRIGFAQTTCTNRDAKAKPSYVQGPYHVKGNNYDCAYIKSGNSQSALMIVAYVMAGICGACVIPLILMVIQWQWHRCRRPKQEIFSTLLKDEEEK